MIKNFFEGRAVKDLGRLSLEDAVKIRQIIGLLYDEPQPRGSKKLEGKGSFYRIRQGDYRLVYEINNNDKEIRIVLIKHRKEAYRKL